VLPDARDVHSPVKYMVLILRSFFFHNVDIFRSVQFVTWQATIPLGRDQQGLGLGAFGKEMSVVERVGRVAFDARGWARAIVKGR
jgi:hypothetical protein